MYLIHISINKMSIYKRYDIQSIYKLNKDKYNLYFPRGAEIIKFSKKINIELNNYINKIINMIIIKDIAFVDYNVIDKKDLMIFINYSKRCSREILYNLIRTNYNYISKARIKYMILVSFILSIKYFFGYDFMYHNEIYTELLKKLNIQNKMFYKNICCKIEIDILKNENFSIAKKVRNRINDTIF